MNAKGPTSTRPAPPVVQKTYQPNGGGVGGTAQPKAPANTGQSKPPPPAKND